MDDKIKSIFTIGHSTHSASVFLEMLHSFGIKKLVDIRRLPGSRKYPQFDQENLAHTLETEGIHYIHMVDLGGRRKVNKDSKNNRWKNSSFRGYADYMATAEFENAILNLEHIALQQPTAYMCSEAVWWRCHRSLVSDYLKVKGWTVMHIMSKGKAKEHTYTSPASVINGKLIYGDEELGF